MNAQQLQRADGTKINAWQCAICSFIYVEKHADLSARCCRCDDCGASINPEVDGYRSKLCKTCWEPHYAKKRAEKLDRAKEIAGYVGPVSFRHKLWGSLSEILDDEDGNELPEFVHTCHVSHYTIDLDDVLTNLLENAGVEDDSQSDFVGVGELQAAVDKFNQANRRLEYWEEDSKHKVRVKRVVA